MRHKYASRAGLWARQCLTILRGLDLFSLQRAILLARPLFGTCRSSWDWCLGSLDRVDVAVFVMYASSL